MYNGRGAFRTTPLQEQQLAQLAADLRIDQSALLRYAVSTALPLGEKLSRRRYDELVRSIAENEHELGQEPR